MLPVPSDQDLVQLSEQLAECLREQSLVLSTAESCTGGWVAKLVTDVPGSSHWFDRGFVTYTNEAKHDMLGVDEMLIREHGAVSEEVVKAMALGSLQRSRAHISLAVSGIAGPGGGTAYKPVGLVWFAWAHRRDSVSAEIEVLSQQHIYKGDREEIRRQAVFNALNGVLERVRA